MEGEKKFKLIPLYDLQAVFNTWKFYVEGIEAVLDNSGTDTSLEKVFNEIMAGRLLLWVGFIDGEYSGFVTTQISDVPTCGRFLWIVHTYKKIKVPSSFLLEGLKRIEEFAREQKCKTIRFYAKEKPWQQKLVALGYTPGYIEYIKEVRDEDLP